MCGVREAQSWGAILSAQTAIKLLTEHKNSTWKLTVSFSPDFHKTAANQLFFSFSLSGIPSLELRILLGHLQPRVPLPLPKCKILELHWEAGWIWMQEEGCLPLQRKLSRILHRKKARARRVTWKWYFVLKSINTKKCASLKPSSSEKLTEVPYYLKTNRPVLCL